jgi:hypothetical protein
LSGTAKDLPARLTRQCSEHSIKKEAIIINHMVECISEMSTVNPLVEFFVNTMKLIITSFRRSIGNISALSGHLKFPRTW